VFAFIDYISKSTLKREYALMLTIFWMYKTETAASEFDYKLLEMFTLPLLTGCFAVFGMEFVAKQTTWGGPPQTPDVVRVEQKVTAPKDASITTNVDQTQVKVNPPKDDGFA
jgi:hypothetical protein